MIVIDNVIKDEKLLQDIENSTDLFPPPLKLPHNKPVNLLDGSERTISEYKFWDGWLNSPADTLKKRIAENIWKRFLPFPEEDLYGVEYWTKTYLPEQYGEWHIDVGFCMCLPNGNGEETAAAKAAIGCVYYPIKGEWEESYLQLRYEDGVESILAKPNRLVIFDSANVYHKSTPTKTHIRYAMPMNLWNKKNPPTLFGDFKIDYDTSISI